ncbi:hypothetical protein PCK1_000855 [Pneumocystis canis]|nr:hypothetical protein PCK1_000855 [Pneumocystis canis]
MSVGLSSGAKGTQGDPTGSIQDRLGFDINKQMKGAERKPKFHHGISSKRCSNDDGAKTPANFLGIWDHKAMNSP